jgi:5-methyltetrahydropteroyltriglutamate--homocysteine methyltransferase
MAETEMPLFPTTLVGSYPQPEWLIDRDKLGKRFPPRMRAKELWLIPEPLLAQAQDDATLLAIHAQEAAGLDIVTDGDSRFDLAVGGKSWFFYPIERITGVEGHRDTSRGWMSRHGLRPGALPKTRALILKPLAAPVKLGRASTGRTLATKRYPFPGTVST